MTDKNIVGESIKINKAIIRDSNVLPSEKKDYFLDKITVVGENYLCGYLTEAEAIRDIGEIMKEYFLNQ